MSDGRVRSCANSATMTHMQFALLWSRRVADVSRRI